MVDGYRIERTEVDHRDTTGYAMSGRTADEVCNALQVRKHTETFEGVLLLHGLLERLEDFAF